MVVGDQFLIRSKYQFNETSIEIEMQSRSFSLMILLFFAYLVLIPLNSFLNPLIYIAMIRGSVFKNDNRTRRAVVEFRNPVYRCRNIETKPETNSNV